MAPLEIWLTAALIVWHLLGAAVTYVLFSYWQEVKGVRRLPFWDFILCLVAWPLAAGWALFTTEKNR